jgi:hypothetical protein
MVTLFTFQTHISTLFSSLLSPNMQFSKFTLLCLLGSSLAAPIAIEHNTDLVKREYRTIDTEIKRLESTVAALNRDYESRYQPRRGDRRGEDDYVRKILGGLNFLAKDLRIGTDNIYRSRDSISTIDLVSLTAKLASLQGNVNKSVQGCINVKPIVDATRQTRSVQDLLIQISREGNSFAQAIIAKLPSGVKGLGQFTGSSFAQSVERGIRAYSQR